MKDVAKWRANDQALDAAHRLAAIRRVSNAVSLDLFQWSDAHREAPDQAA